MWLDAGAKACCTPILKRILATLPVCQVGPSRERGGGGMGRGEADRRVWGSRLEGEGKLIRG